MTNKLKAWSATPALNNLSPPFGWPEGMMPSAINDTARQDRASLREWYEEAEWRDLGSTVVSVVGSVITLAGDVRTSYRANMAVRIDSTTVGSITAVSLSGGNTAVTVTVTPPPTITKLEVGLVSDTVRRIVRGTSSVTAVSPSLVQFTVNGVVVASFGSNAVFPVRIDAQNGISFLNSSVSGSDNNLNYYGNQDWTPSIGGSTTFGTATYTTRIGRLSRIGKTVAFEAAIVYSGATGSGNTRITGLPFTRENVSQRPINAIQVSGGTPTIQVGRMIDGTSPIIEITRAIGTSGEIYVGGIFETA